MNHRVVLHAIDATPARWRGDAGSSPLDRARTAASSPRNDFVKNCRMHPTHWLISTQATTVEHHKQTEEDRRVVVGHLEIPSTAPAEDEQRRPRKHDRFTQEKKVRELHGRTLEAHHPVGDRRVGAARREVTGQFRQTPRVEEGGSAVEACLAFSRVEVSFLRE